MTELEQLQTTFQQQRKGYLNREKEVLELTAEKQQTESTLSAFKNELAELIANAQTKLTAAESLTADDYVALKNADSGLKARIEYYQALSEEIDIKLDTLNAQLFKEREALLILRNDIFYTMASERLNTLIENNKEQFDEVYRLLTLSGSIQPNALKDGYQSTREYAVKQYIGEQIGRAINPEIADPNGYELPVFTGDFKPKSPMRLHAESYETSKISGLRKLIHNLANKEQQ